MNNVTWTKETPTEEGFYWYRDNFKKVPQIVQVEVVPWRHIDAEILVHHFQSYGGQPLQEIINNKLYEPQWARINIPE